MVTDYQRMLDSKLQYVHRLRINPEYVMPAAMLDNWRRRTKRLDRARITAPPGRRVHIDHALERLRTGRLHP